MEEGWRGLTMAALSQQHAVGRLQLSPAKEEGPMKFAAHQDSSKK
jgi:hypothetical protein